MNRSAENAVTTVKAIDVAAYNAVKFDDHWLLVEEVTVNGPETHVHLWLRDSDGDTASHTLLADTVVTVRTEPGDDYAGVRTSHLYDVLNVLDDAYNRLRWHQSNDLAREVLAEIGARCDSLNEALELRDLANLAMTD